MNNINQPHIAIYVGLLAILLVLIGLTTITPLPNFNKAITPSPIPTIFPSISTNNSLNFTPTPKFSLVTPTGTGAQEDLPKNLENIAQQKQNLKKKLPLQEDFFKIDFDYTNDKFVITFRLQDKDEKIKFQEWLINNYPLLTLDKFIFK